MCERYLVIQACAAGEVFIEWCTREVLEKYCKEWEDPNMPVQVLGPDDKLPEQFNEDKSCALIVAGRIVSVKKGIDYVPKETWRFE